MENREKEQITLGKKNQSSCYKSYISETED
jgi:hypothetical protein